MKHIIFICLVCLLIGAIPARANLIAHWTFDEAPGSGTTADQVGSYDLTIDATNAAIVADTPGVGNQLDTDAHNQTPGLGAYIADIGTTPLNLGYNNTDFTIEMWVRTKPQFNNDWERLFNVWVPDGGYSEFALEYTEGTRWLLSNPEGSPSAFDDHAGSINDGEWHHMAVSGSPTNTRVQFFIDGVKQLENTSWTYNQPTTEGLYFGVGNRRNDPGRVQEYVIDELKVFNSEEYTGNFSVTPFPTPAPTPSPTPTPVSTPTTLAAWTFDSVPAGSGTGTIVPDFSEFGFDLTVGDDGEIRSGGKYGNCLVNIQGPDTVSGGGKQAVTGDLGGTAMDWDIAGEFTFEGWIRRDGDYGRPDDDWTTIFSIGNITSSMWLGDYYYLLHKGDVDQLQLYADGLTDRIGLSLASEPFPVGQWVHIAWVRDAANNFRFYLDGYRWLDVSGIAGDGFDSGSTVKVSLLSTPQHNGEGSMFPGSVDDVRISNFARYTDNFTPPTSIASPPNQAESWTVFE